MKTTLYLLVNREARHPLKKKFEKIQELDIRLFTILTICIT